MLLEVGAQLTPMEMDFLCFSSALKSLVSSLGRQKKKEKHMGYIFFHPSVSPTSEYWTPLLDSFNIS